MAGFARALGLNPFLKLVMRLLSYSVRKKARALGVNYSFLFMRADGQQLSEIATLIEAGAIHPVVDKVFPFTEVRAAFEAMRAGEHFGKIVLTF